MANYLGAYRTNYFKVKDRAAFQTFLDRFENASIEVLEGQDKNAGRIALLETDGEGWPSDEYNETTDEWKDIDFHHRVAEHLADGEVVVFVSAGFEKLRYVSGGAIALDNSGKSVSLHLNDIYKKAKKAFGVEPTEASY